MTDVSGLKVPHSVAQLSALSGSKFRTSGLFRMQYSGWFDHDNYIATGAWSIGNELVFYSIFPIMLLLSKKSIKQLIIFFIITIAFTGYFSVFLLDSNIPLAEQWNIYINPLNQLYLFTSGVLIGWFFKNKDGIKDSSAKVIFILSVLTFTFFPIIGENQISFVTGLGKIILSISIIFMVIGVMYINVSIKNKFNKILNFFGDISYSIYLLHPIVYKVYAILLMKFGLEKDIPTTLLLIIISSLISAASYYFIERPFVKLARRNKSTKITIT